MKTHYQTLGIPNLSSLPEIKKAYRAMALKHHPDRGGEIRKMQEINSAYEYLMKNKESYDLTIAPSKWKPTTYGFTIVVNAYGWVNTGDAVYY